MNAFIHRKESSMKNRSAIFAFVNKTKAYEIFKYFDRTNQFPDK